MLNELISSTTLLQSYLMWLINQTSGQGATFTLLMAFVILVVFELYNPKEKLPAKLLRQSYRANVELFVFNSVLMSLLSMPSLLALAEHYANNGLLNAIANPVWRAVLSFLAIDLLLYLLHKASHNFDFLWMFHKVHHNDSCLNVSTAFRIHFMEIIIVSIMKAILIIVLGIKGSSLLANELIITFFTMMHHANISFRGELAFGRVFITPYLHSVHHSTEREEHDRNYGTVLSIWDRLFGTLAELNPVAIGLNGSSPQDLMNLIMYGFKRTNNASVQPVDLEGMIAEAAYYKAEKRGFNPGYELKDWLDARSEIIRLVYGEEQVRNHLIQKWRGLISSMINIFDGRNRKYPMFRKQAN
ncbi:MAG: sterol desaturase family protein [Methylobacter sp.]|nr:sterol desaturase family protein [Methylobacter sp.]